MLFKNLLSIFLFFFYRFATKESATHAIVAVHNSDINGQPVKCSWGKESGEPIVSQNASQVCSSQVRKKSFELTFIFIEYRDTDQWSYIFVFYRRRWAIRSFHIRLQRTANNSVTGIRRVIQPHSYRDSSCRAYKDTRTDSLLVTNKVILGKSRLTYKKNA